jgi:hypothetical protein
MDCHSPDTEWLLLGVYRQEFYQYIEQISKHLWAIDDYEYVVALAGLAYMTDSDCFGVGYDSNGNYIYAGVAPQPYGKFEMALYTDTYCLVIKVMSIWVPRMPRTMIASRGPMIGGMIRKNTPSRNSMTSMKSTSTVHLVSTIPRTKMDTTLEILVPMMMI